MSPERLLLLEDDAPLREVLRDALTDEGWEVVSCASYDDLLREAQLGSAAIAISDCWGPSQTNLDPGEREQIVALAACVPVVLLTGRSWALDARGSEDLGLAGVVGKPFDLDNLLQVISAAPR